MKYLMIGMNDFSGKINRDLVLKVSKKKGDPDWVRDFRLKSLESFEKLDLPKWGPDLVDINFEEIAYYADPGTKNERSWDDVPQEIKETFEKLGIPEAERKFFAGVEAQFDSEVVYKKAKEYVDSLGIIFTDADTAQREYPEIVKRYFGKLVPASDNKFAALNSIFFSGGTFLYIPAGVKVALPLQAYFRMNAERFGQFERTLIIAEKGSDVHYIEGCSAPTYASNSLHAAVVEIFVGEGAKVQYTTIQNWSNNVYNLVTKRSLVEKNGTMEWVDGNIGSKVTMKYPACILKGEGAHGEILSISMASEEQNQDTGTKMIHLAPNTTSRVVAKSIAKNGGVATYRGVIEIKKNADESKSNVNCDSLIFGDSKTNTYPKNISQNKSSIIQHEASASKIDEVKLRFLQSRGINESDGTSMVVKGFLDPIIKKLPIEYSIEMMRLTELQMEGSVG